MNLKLCNQLIVNSGILRFMGRTAGTMDDALDRARKLVAQYPAQEVARFSLGKLLYDRGLFAEAREQLEPALAKRPDWMAAAVLIGKCAQQTGDKDSAKIHFEKALQLAIAQAHDGPREEMEALLREME